jgi:hypothetical protein
MPVTPSLSGQPKQFSLIAALIRSWEERDWETAANPITGQFVVDS